MDITKDAIAHVLQVAGERAFEVVSVPDAAIPHALIQSGYTLQSLESHLGAPVRIRQAVELLSPQAFVAYVRRFKERGTVVFSKDHTFTAKLDYHNVVLGPPVGADLYGEPDPSWCTHTASYGPKVSRAWAAWKKAHKVEMSQVEFADFIEERMVEITAPVAGDVLTAVRDFKESRSATLESVQEPRNGNIEFKYISKGSPMTASFPHDITLWLPVFDYHEPQLLKAEIRYTTNEGQLRLKYRFARDPLDIEDEHFKKVSDEITAQLAGIPLFEGAASK